MSMISGQVDRLRTAAQTYRNVGNHSAENMFLDAADTITELRDDLQRANAENARLREECDCVGMASYELGYKNGSVHYELEHCPACKNVADLQEALEENARLRSCLSDDAENAQMIMAENAKLRGLVRDLMPLVCDGCHERLCDMPKEEHPFVECMLDCRMRELGIEKEDEE